MATPVPLARRMVDIAPFQVMELLARAQTLEAEGRSIVHMEVGEPDFPTPEPIVRAGQRALKRGYTRYTPATGLPELREVVAGFYQSRYGVAVEPERVVITPGASGALQLVLGVLIDPGSRVLLADPGYPCNRHFVRLFEGEPVGIPVGAATAYQLDPATVERAWTATTRAVIIGSPANPTGAVISQSALEGIHRIARARGGRLIVDEIYHGLVYLEEAATALEGREDVFVVNSFSKYFGMTGWRVGWLVAPVEYVREIEKLAQNLFLAPPTPSQHAALAAFRPETLTELEHRRSVFRERRDFLLSSLPSLGMRIAVEPQGAFYVYADCSALGESSQGLAGDLLEQAGVAVTPGLDFGTYRAQEHLRFAYTTSLPQLQEGVRRIRGFLERRGIGGRGRV